MTEWRLINRLICCHCSQPGECEDGDFYRLIAEELGCSREDIMGTDLFLVTHAAKHLGNERGIYLKPSAG